MKRMFTTVLLGILISLFQQLPSHATDIPMTITSPAFNENQPVPQEYTCLGSDKSPTLNISGTPENAKSLVLIVDDPDAPMGTWVHWVVYNIPPETKRIDKGGVAGTQGLNDFGKFNYGGPCPPDRPQHHYFFKIYALDTRLSLIEGSTKADVENAMKNHILAKAQLIGTYQRPLD